MHFMAIAGIRDFTLRAFGEQVSRDLMYLRVGSGLCVYETLSFSANSIWPVCGCMRSSGSSVWSMGPRPSSCSFNPYTSLKSIYIECNFNFPRTLQPNLGIETGGGPIVMGTCLETLARDARVFLETKGMLFVNVTDT